MSVRRAARRIANRLLAPLDLELRRRLDAWEASPHRATLEGVLEQVRSAGFVPKTAIDVGASFGTFTVVFRRVFPESDVVMVEPLAECHGHLEALTNAAPVVRLVPLAVAGAPGPLTINVHADLMGSSLYLEAEETDVNGAPRQVEATTLDALAASTPLEPPVLLKIDVQGAELDVLRGAGQVLDATEVVLLEASLFRTFRGGPLLHQVVEYLAARGFVVYDVAGLQYRPLDGALSQVDLAFVRDDSSLRRHHAYATPEQRAEQDRRLAAAREQAVRGQR